MKSRTQPKINRSSAFEIAPERKKIKKRGLNEDFFWLRIKNETIRDMETTQKKVNRKGRMATPKAAF